MNKLDYAHFKYEDYEPSLYNWELVEIANRVYKDYATGVIANRQHGFDVLAGIEEVAEYFNEKLLPHHKKDPNYETILDDLMLYVDENNAKLVSWGLIR